MTKTQLIELIAQETEVTKKLAGEMLDAALEGMAEQLIAGEVIHLTGFGTFEAKEVSARKGRNPRTNEEVEIPACRRITFTASKTLKEKLNET